MGDRTVEQGAFIPVPTLVLARFIFLFSVYFSLSLSRSLSLSLSVCLWEHSPGRDGAKVRPGLGVTVAFLSTSVSVSVCGVTACSVLPSSQWRCSKSGPRYQGHDKQRMFTTIRESQVEFQ